jgi:uncharacterized protein (TIGR03000 family)
MFRRVPMLLVVPVVAASALALTTIAAEARPRGGARGGGGRGGVGPRGGVIGPRGGVIGWRGRGLFGPGIGVGGRAGFRRYGFGGLGFGLGLGLGFGGFGYGYGGPGVYGGYGSYAGYAGNRYGGGYGGDEGYAPYMLPNYSGYVMPGAADGAILPSDEPRLLEDAPPAPPNAKGNDNSAHLLVLVPENATVWFEGEKMNQTGTEREFVSPPLTARKRFVYTIRVRYTNDEGKVVDETKKVYVRAGDRWSVDFNKPTPRVVDPLPVPRDVD